MPQLTPNVPALWSEKLGPWKSCSKVMVRLREWYFRVPCYTCVLSQIRMKRISCPPRYLSVVKIRPTLARLRHYPVSYTHLTLPTNREV